MTLQIGDVFPDIASAKQAIKTCVAANGETSRTVKSDQIRVLLLLQEFNDVDEQDWKRFVDSKTEKSDNTGWWNFVQWQPYFGSRNIRHIAHASRLPDRNDNLMIKRVVDGLSSLHDNTPYWLRTANSTEKVETGPWYSCRMKRAWTAKKKQEKASEAESGGESGEEEDSEVENNKETIKDETEEEEEEEGESEAKSDDTENLVQSDEDVTVDDPMKDYCELTKFTTEQEWLLQELYKSLESRDDKEE
ncbi:hypothetical protein BKA65DRAFT_481262 [Rhexocercosporidium sp. MPI-PUGE-AT-0058]|nr:hypothetical protein BKA65DRAFT_481262 [Rhexocercosporidium sp. MPI-PUGE-AT-0058]